MHSEALAVHEAGHVVVAEALGCRVDAATVQSGSGKRGCTLWRRRSVSPALPGTDVPVILFEPDWQRRLTADVCVALAGGVAEGLFVPRATGRVPDAIGDLAVDELSELSDATSSAERERAAAAVDEPVRDDAAESAYWAFIACGADPLRAGAWLRWLELETRALLATREREVKRLAALLTAVGTAGHSAIAACLRMEGE